MFVSIWYFVGTAHRRPRLLPFNEKDVKLNSHEQDKHEDDEGDDNDGYDDDGYDDDGDGDDKFGP